MTPTSDPLAAPSHPARDVVEMETMLRAKILAALAKPLPEASDALHSGVFDPWGDVISGFYGNYASECDRLFIGAMEAARDTTTFSFVDREGFAAEMVLYILAGHGMLNYGTSPRGGWPDEEIADLWQPLIDKWRAYTEVVWQGDILSPTPPET